MEVEMPDRRRGTTPQTDLSEACWNMERNFRITILDASMFPELSKQKPPLKESMTTSMNPSVNLKSMRLQGHPAERRTQPGEASGLIMTWSVCKNE